MSRREPELVPATLALLERALASAHAPAVMCSFGKDSLVALHLARRLSSSLPVIFHREPFAQGKYAYAHRLIEEWGLEVYDYPPAHTAAQLTRSGTVEVANFYEIGGGRFCIRPTGIDPPVDGQPFLCALRQLLGRPRGRFAYPWDLVVHGHKSCDVDPAYGPMPLAADLDRPAAGVATCFPLRYWSDQDVWAYIEHHDLPVNHACYERTAAGRWQARADRTGNPDYFSACTACMVPGVKSAWCPKLQLEIAGCSDQIPWNKAELFHYCMPTAPAPSANS